MGELAGPVSQGPVSQATESQATESQGRYHRAGITGPEQNGRDIRSFLLRVMSSCPCSLFILRLSNPNFGHRCHSLLLTPHKNNYTYRWKLKNGRTHVTSLLFARSCDIATFCKVLRYYWSVKRTLVNDLLRLKATNQATSFLNMLRANLI